MEHGLGQVTKTKLSSLDGLEFCSKTYVSVGSGGYFIPNLHKVIFRKTVYTNTNKTFHKDPSAHVDLTRSQYKGYARLIDVYLTATWERMGGKKYIAGENPWEERRFAKKNYGDAPGYTCEL
jgi:hypothetical protein